jgi:hypothetical protein
MADISTRQKNKLFAVERGQQLHNFSHVTTAMYTHPIMADTDPVAVICSTQQYKQNLRNA